MSEEKKPATVEKTEDKAKAPKKKAAPVVEDFAAQQKKAQKAWTLAKCLRAARRFESEAAWRTGAPSSYKSAAAHGWTKNCIAAIKVAHTASGNKGKSSGSRAA